MLNTRHLARDYDAFISEVFVGRLIDDKQTHLVRYSSDLFNHLVTIQQHRH